MNSTPMTVVATTSTADAATLSDYAAAVSRVDGVARVDSLTGSYADGNQIAPANPASARFTTASGTGTWLSVVTDVEPYSNEGKQVVSDIRAVDSPLGETLVGGSAAVFADSQDAMGDRLPWAIGIIAISTFLLLFLFTGSVIIPIKALLLNTLSLSATFGAMVWIFQEGHLSGLLGMPRRIYTYDANQGWDLFNMMSTVGTFIIRPTLPSAAMAPESISAMSGSPSTSGLGSPSGSTARTQS